MGEAGRSGIGAPAPALRLPDTAGEPRGLPAGPGEASATVVVWT